jgi:hypothetical protein
MTDVLFLAILIAFFALAVVFVRACDRIIGPGTESADVADASGGDAEQVAA